MTTDHATLKTKYTHFDNFIVPDGTISCHGDNLRCDQWRQSYQNDDILFSVKKLKKFNSRLIITRLNFVKQFWFNISLYRSFHKNWHLFRLFKIKLQTILMRSRYQMEESHGQGVTKYYLIVWLNFILKVVNVDFERENNKAPFTQGCDLCATFVRP